MKFRKAVKQMQKGYCIRRPHWEYGEYLFMSDKGSIVKCPADPIAFDISMEIWKANVSDILADDWECDLNLLLTNCRCFINF